MGPPQDVSLIIATPLLIVPLFVFLSSRQTGVEELLLAVALGHHLPGMMRAYGDRDLFERFRTRFILGPLLLVPICVFLSIQDLAVLAVIVVLWGTWHGLAQAYGFARIYDAKQGNPSALTRHLDLGLCVAWFGAGIVFSPERLGELLQQFYASGGTLLPPAAVGGFQTLWMAATALVSVAFVGNLCVAWRRGRPPNLPKLALLVSSCGFWWYAMVGIENAILGVAWFELFHDVQYLTIVWAFNRRVVEKGGRVGHFTRFLFRRSGAMVALYVGLVVVYGALNPFDILFASGTFHGILAGVIVTSSLLHFYYDGFIWKVRDRSIKAGLDLEGGSLTRRRTQPHGLRHAAAWGLLGFLTLGLGANQVLRPPGSKLDRYANLAAIVPDFPANLAQLGDELYGQRRFGEAVATYERAIELRPGSALAYAARGMILSTEMKFPQAITAYRNALRLDPRDVRTLGNLGIAFFQLGELSQARSSFEDVLALDPENYSAITNLGAICERQRDFACAKRHYERAVDIDPGGPVAHDALQRIHSRRRPGASTS